MNFSEASKAMDMGNRVARESWRGIISFWFKTKEGSVREVKPTGRNSKLAHVTEDDKAADDWWIVT